MNCKDFEILLAEALGGELASTDRPAFEAHLARCSKCREEFESSGRAIETMRSLPGPRRVTVKREGTRLVIEEHRAAGLGPRRGRRPGTAGRLVAIAARSVFRYAAGLLIAFTAGYALHAGMMTFEDHPRGVPAVVETGNDERVASKPTLQGRVVSAHVRNPTRSDLAKCLIAMAHPRH